MTKRNSGSPERLMAQKLPLALPDKRLVLPGGMGTSANGDKPSLPEVPNADAPVTELLLVEGGGITVLGTAKEIAERIYMLNNPGPEVTPPMDRFDHPRAPDEVSDFFCFPGTVRGVVGCGSHRDYWYKRWGFDVWMLKTAGVL